MTEEQRLPKLTRKDCPCNGCVERFTACSGRCPIDARGGYGYKAWKADIEQVKRNRKNYMSERQDDLKRRERWRIKR